MRKNTFTMSLAAMAVAALMGRATATAQTASPYYTGVCEVDPQATSTVVVGNVLSFLEKREFPNKKESLTDEEKQSADLGIGGTYYGDYYTVALNVTEPGAYKIEFDAAHKDQERSLWLYRSATSLPATPQAGDTDEGVEYIEVGEKQMPITGGWTTYEPLTFELDLLEGVNYVKFVFDDRYGGNIGGMRIMRNIPPSPALKTLTVGGVDVLASLDEDGTYTLSLPEGTEQLPEVEAVANELARVEVTQATTDNPVATIKLYDKESGELLATYTIKYELVSQMGGYSFTWDVGDGTTKPLADGSKYKYVRESVSNPAFKIKGVVDIYSDSRYKIKAGQEFALCVPANAVVETVTFVNCSENYYNRPEGSNLDSEWDYIASGNAKVEMEGGMAIGEARDMTATITGHQAGTPITFAVKKCGEVAYSGIRIGYSQLNDHSLNYIGASLDDGATTPVSGSITLYFDRNISYSDSLLVTVDGNTVRSEISGTSLTAYYWELPYATEHTFRLGAGAVRDIFNNKYGEEVKIGFATESEQPVEMAVYDYIVGDTTEFYNALKAINESNTTADAPQKRIFLKNGDYVLREEGTKIDAYNVSLIGQSQEGVLLRSESTHRTAKAQPCCSR